MGCKEFLLSHKTLKQMSFAVLHNQDFIVQKGGEKRFSWIPQESKIRTGEKEELFEASHWAKFTAGYLGKDRRELLRWTWEEYSERKD